MTGVDLKFRVQRFSLSLRKIRFAVALFVSGRVFWVSWFRFKQFISF